MGWIVDRHEADSTVSALSRPAYILLCQASYSGILDLSKEYIMNRARKSE
jgi:hypothetical protein